jgi:hypothetical protein
MESLGEASSNQTGLCPANHFELTGKSIKSIYVNFSNTGFAGIPILSYRDNRIRRSFSGHEIRFQDTETGQWITVTLEAVGDGDTVTFSLALPPITVRSGAGIVITVPGIIVTNPSTIDGPPPGPQKFYSVVYMQGTAQAVDF